jgi:hypothetical protein
MYVGSLILSLSTTIAFVGYGVNILKRFLCPHFDSLPFPRRYTSTLNRKPLDPRFWECLKNEEAPLSVGVSSLRENDWSENSKIILDHYYDRFFVFLKIYL